MVVSESELVGNRCTVHGGIDNNKGVNEEINVVSINEDLDLSSRRHGSSDSSSLFSSEASLEDPPKEEDPKTVTNHTSPPTTEMMEQDGNYNPDRILEGVFATTESLPPAERSDASHESCLFSIHPGTSSFGKDQALILEPKTCESEEPTKSNGPVSVEPSPDKNVSQEKIPGTKEPPNDKIKDYGGKTNSPNATVKQSNASHHSTGSESSSYSFAFPILVPVAPQRASRKTDAINPQGRSSFSRDEPHLEGENSISRPNPPPASRKKRLCCCCCCFPCQSFFPNCFFC